MPHEPTREAPSARQLVEAASAFAQREMLPEARQAVQDARAALALRSDVGTAHWCDACLVALEIAARGGDFAEMETEAAQLRSLSRGGGYWTEKARTRIGEHAHRIDPARLDHVLAVLAGEASPAAPDREHAPIPEYPVDARCPLPREPLVSPLAASAISTAADDLSGEPVAPPAAASTRLDSSPAISADCTPRAADMENPTGYCAGPYAIEELDTAGICLRDARPPFSLASARPMAHRPTIVGAALRLKPAARDLLRSRIQGGILAALVLSSVLWASRSTVGPSRISVSAAEHALHTGNAARALQIASAAPDAGQAVPYKHLVFGWALLESGDTAGAAAAFARAAQSDSRGAIAWTAAETLARLPNHSASAADAYLLAFAAGLPADRAEIVARAQELAGRPDRARRVREQSAVP